MKILLLSQFFSTTRGGGEYVISLIAKKLAESNHKVWVITNHIKGEKYSSHENIKVVIVPPSLKYEGGLPPSFSDNLQYFFNATKKGLQIIKKEKIDIIHSNNFSPALAGSFLSFLTSKPHITTIHDIFSLCGKDYWKKWGEQSGVSTINVKLAPFFEKLILKLKHDCTHTVSEATRDDLIKFGEKKPIYVIHNAVIDESVSNEETNPLQYVCVGRLVFYKNLEVIIKAINIVRKTQPKVKLILIGGGPHKKSLGDLTKKLRLESNIIFKGYLTAEEKTKLIASSNALLFPSLCEGFGLVILEAFSQSRPVLVSKVRPLSDIVSHENTGFVLEPHNEKVWAEHILKLIKNPQESEIMGKNGNELLKTKYNPDIMFEKIMEMYNNVLSKR